MVERDRFAFEIGRCCWLVNTSYVPSWWFVHEDTFQFCVVIEAGHMFSIARVGVGATVY